MSTYKAAKTELARKGRSGKQPARLAKASERFLSDDHSMLRMAEHSTPSAMDLAALEHLDELRRLTDKPQAMGENRRSAIRTRLTHSIEVASNARAIGRALGCNLDILAGAALGHDLGHPPYGHNGEVVLAEFMDGYGGYEGNPQSFRILTRLGGRLNGRPIGINATRAFLDGGLKYPWLQVDAPPNKSHKYGAYEEDAELFQWVREGAPPGERCIEAQIMDWSDDVAYAISDFEDMLRFPYPNHNGSEELLLNMGLILDSSEERRRLSTIAANKFCSSTPDEVLARFEQFLGEQELTLNALRTIDNPAAARSQSARAAVRALSRALRDQLQADVVEATLTAIDDGSGKKPRLRRYNADLVIPTETEALCAAFKAVNEAYVLNDAGVLRDRAQQQERLWDILNVYTSHPEAMPEGDKKLFRSHLDDAGQRRAVVDRVSRMTDSSANAEHERLQKIYFSEKTHFPISNRRGGRDYTRPSIVQPGHVPHGPHRAAAPADGHASRHPRLF